MIFQKNISFVSTQIYCLLSALLFSYIIDIYWNLLYPFKWVWLSRKISARNKRKTMLQKCPIILQTIHSYHKTWSFNIFVFKPASRSMIGETNLYTGYIFILLNQDLNWKGYMKQFYFGWQHNIILVI